MKSPFWQPQTKPSEGPELTASRQLIVEVIFGLYYEKKQLLEKTGMPAQPIRLDEIFKRIESRVQILRACHQWRFPLHEKRWWDRRVNEAAEPKFYPDGVPKVRAATAGWYEPNPLLFEKKPLEATQ